MNDLITHYSHASPRPAMLNEKGLQSYVIHKRTRNRSEKEKFTRYAHTYYTEVFMYNTQKDQKQD